MANKRKPHARHKERGPLDAARPVLDRIIFGIALVGMLVAAHLYIQQGRGFDRGCLGFSEPTGVAADCAAVTGSEASKLLGVSNAIWGFGFYAAIAALSFMVLFGAAGRRVLLKKVRALAIGGGLLYSGYLVFYQLFNIGEVCVLCMTSASLVLLLAIVQGIYLFKPPADPMAPPAEPSRPYLANPRAYAGLVAAVLVIVAVDFVYFNGLEVATVQPAQFGDVSGGVVPGSDQQMPVRPAFVLADSAQSDVCRFDVTKKPVEDWRSLISMVDPYKGNPEAPVAIIEYFDPNCPHCRTAYPTLKRVAEKYGDEAVFYYKPFVLWQHSIAQSAALYAAAQEGGNDKFFDMMEYQFANQTARGLSEQQLRTIASNIGLDADLLLQRVRSGMWSATLETQRQQGSDIGVNVVPTVLVNGRFVDSNSRTFECLGHFIEQATEQAQGIQG